MARRKQNIRQADYALMEVREDLIDADDLEARARSLRKGRNIRSLASRVVEGRPGTRYLRDAKGIVKLVEIRPADGLVLALMIHATEIRVIDKQGNVVWERDFVPWRTVEGLWVQTLRDETFIGHPIDGMFVLSRSDAGAWSLDRLAFEDAPGGELAQPYWVFHKGTILLPSARTGDITLRTNNPVFTPLYVGMRIRYQEREILVTGYDGPKGLRGTVISSLPPSFRITLAAAGDFRVGDAVIGNDSGFEGVVRRVNGVDIEVVTLKNFEGPADAENLSGPASTSTVSSSVEITPIGTTVWDEPLFSQVHGYPRSASAAAGRMIFVNFPKVPDVIAVSSTRSVRDFQVGANADDAITRQMGDTVPRFYHAINAGDVILLSDRGCYYIPTRSSGGITPQNFNAVLFDERAAADIEPVLADDGVVFVDATRRIVNYASLAGSVNLRWRVRNMTIFHHQLIRDPVGLCGPSASFRSAEKYVMVVNGDGTMACVSWQIDLAEETVGFSGWETQGKFKLVSAAFDQYLAVTEREVNGETRRFLEVFDEDVRMDCSSVGTMGCPVAPHLPSTEVGLVLSGDFGGRHVLDAAGDYGALVGSNWELGLPFECRMGLWAMEVVESARFGRMAVRVIRLSVSVQNTTTFVIRINGVDRRFGGYRVGDDVSQPIPRRTAVYTTTVLGNRRNPELEIIKDEPGPFRVTSTTQEVQI